MIFELFLKVRKLQKKTIKRLNKITRLLRIVSQQNKADSSNSTNNRKPKDVPEERGVDNKAFTISDGITEVSDHAPKNFRRKSIVEKMLPENQRHARRRGSLPPADTGNEKPRRVRTQSGTENMPSAENVETINELIAAVEDLIENEFQEEISELETEDKNSTALPTIRSESIDDTSTPNVNSSDVTIHV